MAWEIYSGWPGGWEHVGVGNEEEFECDDSGFPHEWHKVEKSDDDCSLPDELFEI